MRVACEVAYQNYDPPDWAESEIRAHVAGLAEYDGRLVSCRVRLQLRAGAKARRVPPVVHVELGVRDHDPIVVSYEPDRLWVKYARPDLHNALNEAFIVAAQRLSAATPAHAAPPAQDAPREDAPRPALGQIAELYPDRHGGYVLTQSGELLFFHREALMNGSFENLQIGETIAYLPGRDATGPIAVRLRVRD